MRKDLFPTVLMGTMLIIANIIAIVLVAPYQQAGLDGAFENPDDPVKPFFFIIYILLMTGVLLLLIKMGKEIVLKYLLYFVFWLMLVQVLLVPFAYLFFYGLGLRTQAIWDLASLMAMITALLLVITLDMARKWYVTNAVGVLVAAGGIALFGVNFSILPTVLFLIILAVYDYIAVYKTKHMLTLADGVMGLNAPIMLSAPKRGAAPMNKRPSQPKVSIKESIEKGVERDAMYMGLGDIIIPGILVVSSLVFLPMHDTMGLWGARLVSMGTLAGIVLSYIFLGIMVMRGKPQAGLPFLNTGAILGYSISYIVIYQSLTLGMNFAW